MRCKCLLGVLAVMCLLLHGCPPPGAPGEPNSPSDPNSPGEPNSPGDANAPGDPNWPGDPNSSGDDLPRLDGAINVVGATWVDAPLDESATAKLLATKSTGGPTIVPPTVTSNSSESFDVEVAEVDDSHKVSDVAQLRVGLPGYSGHFVLDVGSDDRTAEGAILVTVVREEPGVLTDGFDLQFLAEDDNKRTGDITDVPAAFFAASAGEDGMAGVGDTVALSATLTGATGVTTIAWSQVSGPSASIADPASASTTFVPPAVGTYVMKLEAVDATGVIDVDLVTTLVVDTFTVDAGESGVVQVGEEVQLRGLAAGGSGQATFEWTEVSGHGVEVMDSDSRIASFVPAETGEYEFTLTATDDIEGEASDSVIYKAVSGLTADASAPAEALPGTTIQLQGQAAGGLLPYAFRWSQTGGPAVQIVDATNQTALVSLSEAGDYTFKLLVEDSAAARGADTVTVSVMCQDSLCNDGLYCNGEETCVNGECAPGTPPCPDGVPCDEENDLCLTCPEYNDCDDGDACTVDECDPATGICSHEPVDCDDGDPCTEDTCDPNLGCVNTPIVCGENEICICGECVEICPPDCNSLIFFDDFEEGFGDWSVDGGNWQVGRPTYGPPKDPNSGERAYSGVQVAATVLAGKYAQNDSRLVSRAIQLPVIRPDDKIHLHFWHWFAFDDYTTWNGHRYYDSGTVQIRERTCAGEWAGWTSFDAYTLVSGVWSPALTVDLSAYSGKEIQIGFRLNGDSTSDALAGWYIDDVRIEGSW